MFFSTESKLFKTKKVDQPLQTLKLGVLGVTNSLKNASKTWLKIAWIYSTKLAAVLTQSGRIRHVWECCVRWKVGIRHSIEVLFLGGESWLYRLQHHP